MKYGPSTLVFLVLSSLLMGRAFGASKDSPQDLFHQKTTSKVFKEVSHRPFEVTPYKSQYEYFLEGTEPKEPRKNQKVNKITTAGQSIEVRSADSKKIVKIIAARLEELKITDDRKRVERPDLYPNSTNVFMKMFFGKGHEEREYNGSGVMVGPYSVLTAAHNVYDKDTRLWAEHITVSPGANSGSAYFGTSNVARAFIPKDYFEGNDTNDMALLTIDQEVGKQTGWATLCALDNTEFEDTEFWVTGYPGDKEAGQLWEMNGPIIDVTALVLKCKIATVEGQSGSPLWQKAKASKPPRVVGVHVRAGMGEWNEATRITRDRLDWIIGCLKESTSQQIVQQASPASTTLSVPTELASSENSSTSDRLISQDSVSPLLQPTFKFYPISNSIAHMSTQPERTNSMVRPSTPPPTQHPKSDEECDCATCLVASGFYLGIAFVCFIPFCFDEDLKC
jgi:V8-like Glu-specific endopeptidase